MILKGRRADLTEGRVMPGLLFFTLPIIATSFLQMVYNATDMMVVSLSSEPNAVGAVGSAGPFVNLIVNLFIGFSVGSNVTIARRIGAKDVQGARKATHTAVALALIFGVLCMCIGELVSHPILTLMGISPGAFDLSLTYTRIYFIGIPFIALTNFLISVCRARGDSATPMRVLAFSGFVNVCLNLFMVLVVGLSVEGVAIATVAANIISFAILFVKLKHSDEYTRISLRELGLDRPSLAAIIHIGLPSAMQGSFIAITNMVVQSSVATVDKLLTPDPELTPVLNGNAAATNLDVFIYTAMNSVYQGVMSFTGQNFGAKRLDRVKRGYSSGLIIVFGVWAMMTGLMVLFRAPLLSLYGIRNGAPGTADAIAYGVAMERMIYIALPYFLCGFLEVSNGVMRGLGRSIPPFFITFTGLCMLRICWNLFVFPYFGTIACIYVGNPITWVATSAVSIPLSLCFIGREKKKLELSEQQ